jgi:arsenate reductase
MKQFGDYINDFELQDIKKIAVSDDEIELMYRYFGSYEAFFNKRAMKYKQMGLKDIIKEDIDYKKYLLMDYTFLKRPVFVIDEDIYAGNSKKIITEIEEKLKA